MSEPSMEELYGGAKLIPIGLIGSVVKRPGMYGIDGSKSQLIAFFQGILIAESSWPGYKKYDDFFCGHREDDGSQFPPTYPSWINKRLNMPNNIAWWGAIEANVDSDEEFIAKLLELEQEWLRTL